MAVQLINIGNIANDGTGDDLREAMLKINANFEEIDLRDDEQTSVSNVGTGIGIFKQKLNYDLQLKSLTAGANITLTEGTDTILVDVDAGIQSISVSADTGGWNVPDSNADLTFTGGNKITTNVVNGTVTLNYNGWESLVEDTTPQLGGTLEANQNSISNASTIAATLLTGLHIGNTVGNVHDIDIRDINKYFQNYWDFGVLGAAYDSAITWIIDSADVDNGTFQNPDTRSIELGII
jgi:hypothetical protein|tara:strand:- start:4742 stop:5452 length:711 start_codon:yes stop_codon:yes gene_type:complete